MRKLVPPLLRDVTFRRFWSGQTVSLFGDQIALLAVPLTAVLVLHADAAQMGLLMAAELLPSLLFSLVAGARVDRRGRRRRTMIIADVGRAVLMATVPVGYLLGILSLPQLYLVAFLTGTFDVLFFVSYNTLFVSMVPPDRYVEGNSLLNGSRAMSFVGGQSVAGVLVSLLTAPGALLLNGLSFVASAVALARIHPDEPPAAGPGPGQLRAGVTFIARSPVVRAALGATATVNYFNFVFFAIFVLYVTTRLHVSPTELGLVLGAGAVGGLIGAAVTTPLTRLVGVGPAFVLSCVVFPAPLLLVPLAAGSRPAILALLFLAEFGSGLGVMVLDISIGSIFSAVIPDELRSRVSGAYRTVNYGVRPLGALTGGALGTVLGLRTTLWIAAAGGLLCVLWTLAGPLRHLKTLPATPVAVAAE
ncbi:MAG: MFS transporter [Actinobacteria bacterium]|nr:MAG: MFS transporter [Actinomycetota bacterium]